MSQQKQQFGHPIKVCDSQSFSWIHDPLILNCLTQNCQLMSCAGMNMKLLCVCSAFSRVCVCLGCNWVSYVLYL